MSTFFFYPPPHLNMLRGEGKDKEVRHRGERELSALEMAERARERATARLSVTSFTGGNRSLSPSRPEPTSSSHTDTHTHAHRHTDTHTHTHTHTQHLHQTGHCCKLVFCVIPRTYTADPGSRLCEVKTLSREEIKHTHTHTYTHVHKLDSVPT